MGIGPYAYKEPQSSAYASNKMRIGADKKKTFLKFGGVFATNDVVMTS